MNLNLNDEANRLFNNFVDWIPNLLEAIVILVIGWIIALALKSIAISALRNLGLNKLVEDLPDESYVYRLTDNPARTIGISVYWLIMIITISMVIAALEIPILTDLINRIYAYIPNIIAAIIILLLALAFSAFMSGLILRWMGDTATGKITATVIPIIIISITGFAILEQLNIAPVIVTTTYIALIGAIAFAFGLAFGLGGKDVAGRLLEQAYQRGSQNLEKFRQDLRTGKDRAKEDINNAKKRIKK